MEKAVPFCAALAASAESVRLPEVVAPELTVERELEEEKPLLGEVELLLPEERDEVPHPPELLPLPSLPLVPHEGDELREDDPVPHPLPLLREPLLPPLPQEDPPPPLLLLLPLPHDEPPLLREELPPP